MPFRGESAATLLLGRRFRKHLEWCLFRGQLDKYGIEPSKNGQSKLGKENIPNKVRDLSFSRISSSFVLWKGGKDEFSPELHFFQMVAHVAISSEKNKSDFVEDFSHSSSELFAAFYIEFLETIKLVQILKHWFSFIRIMCSKTS